VDARDPAASLFSKELTDHGNTVHSRPGPSCWRVSLPTTWDQFLAALSKNHRKQLRRSWRTLVDTGRAVLHTVERKGDLQLAWENLVDLHQLRHLGLGELGCFASRQFTDFHREVTPKLLQSGQLLLHWLELDGRPVAAEYHLGSNGVVYAYQAGMEPEAQHLSPGNLILGMTLRRAIERGYHTFDLLRGDESYKARWKAKPCQALEIRAADTRAGAQLRLGLWLAGSIAKRRLAGIVDS
jgi:CelD/BcsL family acetyltransferase involved in cellulose biosynthesis